jgi:hypothetical protein
MPTNHTPSTGDDIEDALSIIESEGGVGEWEEDRAGGIQRWLFPRFDGAGDLGICETHADQGNHTRTEECEDFEVESGNMYLSRSGLSGYDTDVETIVSWLDAPRSIVGAILLLGEPGTGKTALLEAAVTHADRELETVVCTPDHTKDSLFLRFVGEGHGDVDRNGNPTPYTLGPIPYAAKHGKTLYADEFMLLMDGVKPLFYPLADGRRYLPEGNVDGSALEIHPDFRLVLSSNPLVRGASLPEPFGSRTAGSTLTVETDATMLRDLAIDEAIVSAWEALGTANYWRPAIRELRVADYWLARGNPAQAVSAFLGEHCPESQRRLIRDTVVGYVGGSIREDGRLVVK